MLCLLLVMSQCVRETAASRLPKKTTIHHVQVSKLAKIPASQTAAQLQNTNEEF